MAEDFHSRIDQIMAGENDKRRSMIKSLLYADDADIEAFDRLVDSYLSIRNEKD